MLLSRHTPFPEEHPLLQLLLWHKPYLFYGIKYSYFVMLYSTPYIGLSVIASLAYIFIARQEAPSVSGKLPPYPDPTGRNELFLVLGEVHHAKRPEAAPEPQWLTIPERGLYTGLMVFGAIGSGKTSGCMYPFAEQVLSYHAREEAQRIGGLILEVKGDFCHKVRKILESHGRAQDYIEIGLDADYRYNPLHNDLDAYALAYGIASLLNNLFGKSREPFWQQAYTNLVKFVILLHKVLYDYVTLFDVYAGAINPELLEQKIKEGEERLGVNYLLIGVDDFMRERELETYPFEPVAEANRMKAPATEELRLYLDSRKVAYEIQTESGAASGAEAWPDIKRRQFEAVKRWFYHD